jgi:hypothetical protein
MTNVPTKSERVSFDVRFKYQLYDAKEDRDVDIDDKAHMWSLGYQN